MSTLRRGVAGIAAAVLTMTLAACSHYLPPDTAADVANSRAEVRAAATEVFPALAEALGGRIVAAHGQYNLSGDGQVNRQQYQAAARSEGPAVAADEAAAAVEALGYEVVSTTVDSVAAERGALSLGISLGTADWTVSVTGPYFTIPMDEGPPPSAQESLDLPGVGDVPLDSDWARIRVRETAAQDLPALAGALDGTIIAADGRYVAGDDEEFTYRARVVIEGSQRTATQVVDALQSLGWRDLEADDTGVTGVAGEDTMLTISATGGPSPLLVEISADVPSVIVQATASLDSEALFLPGIDVPQPEPDPFREEVRQEALRDTPALAEALGGAITSAVGEYVSGDDEEYSYQARVLIDGSASTDAQIAQVLESLGWQDLEISEWGGVIGHDGDLTVETTSGPSPFLVLISSDFTPVGVWNTAGVGSEDLFPPGTLAP